MSEPTTLRQLLYQRIEALAKAGVERDGFAGGREETEFLEAVRNDMTYKSDAELLEWYDRLRDSN